MDNSRRISHLIFRKMNESLSPSENMELEEWLSSFSAENRLKFDQLFQNRSSLTRMMMDQAEVERLNKPDWDKFIEIHFPNGFDKPAKIIPIWKRLAVAAAILILLSSGVFYWVVRSRPGSANPSPIASRNDVPAPLGNNTVLTLGDGSRIVLDNMNVGKLAVQGKTNINKTSNGQIVYTSLDGKPGSEVLVNTLSTSYGGSSKVVLPDGSTVWLNSLSSLRFPNVFTGRRREVDLTGEAYFEIAPNKNMPFHVKANGAEITVLGTHFDVMAYGDESIMKTTLLQGSIQISRGLQNVTLQPGLQAQIKGENQIHVINTANLDQVIAWKNGEFQFNVDDISSVMRQLQRWYDIEVVYEGEKPDIHLVGTISRNVSLSNVLKLMEMNGTHFRIEGKKITVLK